MQISMFSAAVLAGGRSSRMGIDKAFLRVNGELLIERQLRCLRATGPAEVLVSGRNDVDYSSFGARVIRDRRADAGPLAGVAVAIEASGFSRILVLAVDMPAMAPPMLEKILSYSADGKGCVPVGEEGLQPLAAVYPKAALLVAEGRLAAKSHSMRGFVEELLDIGLVRALKLEPGEIGYFANWNVPSDCVLP